MIMIFGVWFYFVFVEASVFRSWHGTKGDNVDMIGIYRLGLPCSRPVIPLLFPFCRSIAGVQNLKRRAAYDTRFRVQGRTTS